MVIPSYVAVHTHPKYRREDCIEWRPSRWIERQALADGTVVDDLSTTQEKLDAEALITPHKGSFIAWSEGIRNCPGKRFSQVEFLATMVALFRDWRVDPVPEAGETDLGMSRRRLLDVVENDTGQVLLLQLLHPERTAVSWTRR